MYITFLSRPQCLQTYHEATIEGPRGRDRNVTGTDETSTRQVTSTYMTPRSPNMHFRGLSFVPPYSSVELGPVGGLVNHMAGCWQISLSPSAQVKASATSAHSALPLYNSFQLVTNTARQRRSPVQYVYTYVNCGDTANRRAFCTCRLLRHDSRQFCFED